ncbi:hypothetical protein BD779DRAFT_174268 [Infundibulicybe gibba]|nr:hypothetical protein BD779DRAFT_174268 [Infundibulicybe gibba]
MPANLPLELLYNIFLDAAKTSPLSCRALGAVSSWVRRFTLPLQYRTVSLNHATAVSLFAQSIITPLTCPPGPEFDPTDVLRHLWVSCPAKAVESVVRHCDNLTHLAIHRKNLMLLAEAAVPSSGERTYAGADDLHVVLLDSPMYEEFVLYDEVDALGNPLFGHITHLRFGSPIKLRLEIVVPLMPRLTHFAMPCGHLCALDRGFALDIVERTSIEVFVLVLMDEHLSKVERRAIKDWVRRMRKEEERIYAVTPVHSKLEMEWNAEVSGGATIWDAAVDYTRLLMDRDTVRDGILE